MRPAAISKHIPDAISVTFPIPKEKRAYRSGSSIKNVALPIPATNPEYFRGPATLLSWLTPEPIFRETDPELYIKCVRCFREHLYKLSIRSPVIPSSRVRFTPENCRFPVTTARFLLISSENFQGSAITWEPSLGRPLSPLIDRIPPFGQNKPHISPLTIH